MENISQNSDNNIVITKRKSNNPKGRPVGSGNKPNIGNYVSMKEIEQLLQKAKELAEKGDSRMISYLLDHIFGKARQNIGLDGGEDGKALIIQLSEVIAKKNDPDAKSN